MEELAPLVIYWILQSHWFLSSVIGQKKTVASDPLDQISQQSRATAVRTDVNGGLLRQVPAAVTFVKVCQAAN